MTKPPVKKKWLKLFSHFLENLRIDSKEAPAESAQEGTKLNLWESQQRALDFIGNGLDDGIHFFVILKSRQLGISTITLAILLFWLAIHPRIFGALVIDNDENSQAFRDILTRYMQSFPPGYFGKAFKTTNNNTKFMQFSNGSRLDFLVAGKSKTTWGESRAYTVALLSEVSKYGKQAGLDSFMETLSYDNPNRLYLFESTAHGPNHWKSMWEDAGADIHVKRRLFIGWWSKSRNSIDKKDPRFKVFGASGPSPLEKEKIAAVKSLYGWTITPEQLAWIRWRGSQKGATEDTLNENQPWTESEAFVLSGMSFFQTRRVADDIQRRSGTAEFLAYRFYLGNNFMSSTVEQITDARRIAEVSLRVWENPIEGARYAIGVDPAYGRNDNADRHAISVGRCFADKIVQVAEYATNDVDTRQVTWVLAFLAGRYKNCIVNLEIGGPGHAVMAELNSLRHELRATDYKAQEGLQGDETLLDTMRWYLYNRPDSMKAGFVYNWQTDFKSKFWLMNGFRDAYSTDQIIINSIPCLKEMLEVTQEGSEIRAPGNLHDDRVFAAALMTEAWKRWIQQPMMQEGLTYERLMNPAETPAAKVSEVLNNLAFRFMAREMPEPPINKFLAEKGLA